MFLMSNGVNAVFSGFENSYHQQLNRNFINQYLYAFGVSIILVFILIVTIIGVGFCEIYLIHPLYDSLNIKDASSELFWIDASKFLFFILMIISPLLFFTFWHQRRKTVTIFFSRGIVYHIFSAHQLLFIWLLHRKFSNYNQLYGSIGALLILLFYLWLNAIILLLGFELNASLQRLKQKCNS